MSQQTNSGFNAPGFSVGACDPFESVTALPSVRPKPFPFFAVALQRARRSSSVSWSVVRNSLALAVGQGAGCTQSSSRDRWFAALIGLPRPPFDVTRGVGHTIRPSRPFTGTFGQNDPSL